MQRLEARRARRRILHGIRLAAAAAVATASIAAAVCVFTLHLGIRPVLTGSMRPDYGPGALLITRRIPTTSIRRGMIVLIIPPGEQVVYAHRIIAVTGTRHAPVIFTKGDANTAPDPWHAKITATQVSEVVGSVPEVGRLLVGIRGIGQILLALAGGALALWAGSRWLLGSSPRPQNRRATAGGT